MPQAGTASDMDGETIEPATTPDEQAGTDDTARHIQELEAEVTRLRADRQQSEWKAQVAAETGIPADVLRGDTLEAIQAHAKAIAALMHPRPKATAVHGVDRQPDTPMKNKTVNYVQAVMTPESIH